MKALTVVSVGLVAFLTACGHPMANVTQAPMPAPAVDAQSIRVVKATAKAMLTGSFAALDRNTDKALDKAEFIMMTGLPFELADLNRDGKVTLDEFTSDACVANFGKALRSVAAGVARALDVDKDKKVSATEFMSAFGKTDPTSQGLAKTAFETADHGRDGKLGASEFEDLFVTLVVNGALAGMPSPVYPAAKPADPKPPAPVPGGNTPAPKPPAPAPGGNTPAPKPPAPAPGGNTPAPAPGGNAPAPAPKPPAPAPGGTIPAPGAHAPTLGF